MLAILGAAGNVGYSTVMALRAKGAPVRAILRDAEKAARLEAIGCEVAVADLQQSAPLADAIAGAKGCSDRRSAASADGRSGRRHAPFDQVAYRGSVRRATCSRAGDFRLRRARFGRNRHAIRLSRSRGTACSTRRPQSPSEIGRTHAQSRSRYYPRLWRPASFRRSRIQSTWHSRRSRLKTSGLSPPHCCCCGSRWTTWRLSMPKDRAVTAPTMWLLC